ncbi:TetR/AcrR family transcriptional regulator [Nocardia sp. NPDC057227]|uniref:TetR/AcrR family transcriptional regulator n=1 Tax=Nocardia sp. NPDC057227 TaxID=3346056 RepID=UPI00363C4833
MPRTDARKNRERILTAAADALAEGSLLRPAEVAERAGVGVGTFYRNFPDRDSLLAAVAHERYEELRAEAQRLLRTEPSVEAIGQWLMMFSELMSAFPVLPEAVRRTLRAHRSDPESGCRRMLAAWDGLFLRAQRAGLLRDDVDSRDVLQAVTAIMMSAHDDVDGSPGSGPSAARMTAVLIDGLGRRRLRSEV